VATLLGLLICHVSLGRDYKYTPTTVLCFIIVRSLGPAKKKSGPRTVSAVQRKQLPISWLASLKLLWGPTGYCYQFFNKSVHQWVPYLVGVASFWDKFQMLELHLFGDKGSRRHKFMILVDDDVTTCMLREDLVDSDVNLLHLEKYIYDV
jgi:hypothetical protein